MLHSDPVAFSERGRENRIPVLFVTNLGHRLIRSFHASLPDVEEQWL